MAKGELPFSLGQCFLLFLDKSRMSDFVLFFFREVVCRHWSLALFLFIIFASAYPKVLILLFCCFCK